MARLDTNWCKYKNLRKTTENTITNIVNKNSPKYCSLVSKMAKTKDNIKVTK
ncbi:hypothetical protein GsuE55_11280 [Geobacillus subterraneus]|uniref:Uncharacterized protein n=1 Tax=Geobacillus subterraneus TaxID=129338 RepID=A0A679FNW3_9BACL|nr:hypothetical protein GsuE55_11280 [Geobacillus subterraneus]